MGVKKYSQEVIKEGKRVRWPKKEQFFPTLIAVIIICSFVALILTIEDWGAGTLIGQLKELFAGLKKETTSSSESSSEVETALAVIRFLVRR